MLNRFTPAGVRIGRGLHEAGDDLGLVRAEVSLSYPRDTVDLLTRPAALQIDCERGEAFSAGGGRDHRSLDASEPWCLGERGERQRARIGSREATNDIEQLTERAVDRGRAGVACVAMRIARKRVEIVTDAGELSHEGIVGGSGRRAAAGGTGVSVWAIRRALCEPGWRLGVALSDRRQVGDG